MMSCHYFASWTPSHPRSSFIFLSKSSLRFCLFVEPCSVQALTSCWFISKPPSAFLLPWAALFLPGSRPRASASSKVVVSGRPSVSGNNSVRTPMMKARIPTMSYTGVKMKNGKSQSVKICFVARMLYWQMGTQWKGDTGGKILKSKDMCCWLCIPEVGKPKHQPGTHRRGPPHSQPGTSCCHCPLPKTWREGKRVVRPTATNNHFKINNTSSPVFFLRISVFLNPSEMKSHCLFRVKFYLELPVNSEQEAFLSAFWMSWSLSWTEEDVRQKGIAFTWEK